jgi:hypothetical protein
MKSADAARPIKAEFCMPDRALNFRDLRRAMKKYGAWEDHGRGKGSHTMFFRVIDGREFSLPVPTHDKDVNARYVRRLRKQFKLMPDDGVSDEDFYS